MKRWLEQKKNDPGVWDSMRPSYVSELEEGLRGERTEQPAGEETAGVAILLRDAAQVRLIESAAAQVELVPHVFDELPPVETLARFELIVAEQNVASEVRRRFAAREEHGEGINPAVIAVQQQGVPAAEDAAAHFDGVLQLPMTPAAVAAQVSLIVYAHRAFARRYQTALEELHLNRRIFRSVTSGISVANASKPDLPLVYVNPAFEVMTGYRLEDVLGKNCRFLQGSERSQETVTLLREAIREKREVLTIIKNFRKDGTPFWNELSLSPIRNREGELTHFVGIQTDVTARVEFEAALRESEKLAAVGRLASSIAHEINNPLESVMNLLYLAQGETDVAEMKRYVSQADRELKRVALITSQSLRFYKQSTKPQAIGASELLESVLDMYEGRAENSRVTVERRERARTPVLCLESEIRQVLNNLVRNALDAMHGQGGGRLLVRTHDATDWRTGTRGVVVTVADDGMGMSADTMSEIYRPFFTTKGIAGTGLGLWISSEIVMRHGGRLRVRSSQTQNGSTAKRGHGTIFTLFLPAAGPLNGELRTREQDVVAT